MRPRLAMTLGDPRGIGPEIVAKALADPRVVERCDVLVVGAEGTGVHVNEAVDRWVPESGPAFAGRLSGLAIERAVELAAAGVVQGIVTAPIDKAALHAGGFKFPGHTEMLGYLTASPVAMMLASDRLRVVLATTHVQLRQVPDALTREGIFAIAALTRDGLREWFGIAEPRIALCALNPHGGEGGRFGSEEEELLAPAAREAKIEGPFSADTVFVRAMRGEFDAVIAPYHDVGMTAIKVASFGSAVNITLGLPFPRTSPDHGTALDIAGLNKADPSSMIAATLLCASAAASRGRSSGGPPAYGDPPPASRYAGHPSPGQ